jgi:hypothetical protein
MRMTSFGDLLGPQPIRLPGNPAVEEALAAGDSPTSVAGANPTSSLAWAYLAEAALGAGEPVAAYAYARTGYHRGLDQLRRNGWKGSGPVPFDHPGNRGFLRAVAALARAAEAIGESDEHDRCLDLIEDCDPRAAAELGLG